MTTEMYVCDRHGTTQQRGVPCCACYAAFLDRRPAATMTGDERAEELRWWGTQATISWPDLKQRFDELVGREVWTHEYADVEALIEEARTGQHPTMDGVMEKLPTGVPVLVVDLHEG